MEFSTQPWDRGPQPSQEQGGSYAWVHPVVENQAGFGPASGEGRTLPAVYRPRTLVTATVLREVQMGKGANDR